MTSTHSSPSPSWSKTPPSPPSDQPAKSHFLSLPRELITQILLYLFPPSHLSTLSIRSLFLRTNYRQIYMTQHPKQLNESLPLLTVNHDLSNQALNILYGYSMWRCTARIAELGSQIGRTNFGRIRRMEIGYEDLPTVVECLEAEFSSSSKNHTTNPPNSTSKNRYPLRFSQLEILECDGYRGSAFDMHGLYGNNNKNNTAVESNTTDVQITPLQARIMYKARTEALTLCTLLQKLIKLHPLLNILTQQDPKCWGGADAVDLSMGRVRWRLVRDTRIADKGFDDGGGTNTKEHIVDLDHVISVLKGLLEKQEVPKSAVPAAWMEDGSFRQHLFLV